MVCSLCNKRSRFNLPHSVRSKIGEKAKSGSRPNFTRPACGKHRSNENACYAGYVVWSLSCWGLLSSGAVYHTSIMLHKPNATSCAWGWISVVFLIRVPNFFQCSPRFFFFHLKMHRYRRTNKSARSKSFSYSWIFVTSKLSFGLFCCMRRKYDRLTWLKVLLSVTSTLLPLLAAVTTLIGTSPGQ